jgi:hypothetical protein
MENWWRPIGRRLFGSRMHGYVKGVGWCESPSHQTAPAGPSNRTTTTRVRLLLLMATVFFIAAPADATLLVVEDYGARTYTPGIIEPSHYDNCAYWNKRFVTNHFYKSGNYLGKALFINLSGGWIGAAEDTSATTVLERYDLISTVKKGAVKNTSASATYYASGAVKWDNSTGAITCL